MFLSSDPARDGEAHASRAMDTGGARTSRNDRGDKEVPGIDRSADTHVSKHVISTQAHVVCQRIGDCGHANASLSWAILTLTPTVPVGSRPAPRLWGRGAANLGGHGHGLVHMTVVFLGARTLGIDV